MPLAGIYYRKGQRFRLVVIGGIVVGALHLLSYPGSTLALILGGTVVLKTNSLFGVLEEARLWLLEVFMSAEGDKKASIIQRWAWRTALISGFIFFGSLFVFDGGERWVAPLALLAVPILSIASTVFLIGAITRKLSFRNLVLTLSVFLVNHFFQFLSVSAAITVRYGWVILIPAILGVAPLVVGVITRLIGHRRIGAMHVVLIVAAILYGLWIFPAEVGYIRHMFEGAEAPKPFYGLTNFTHGVGWVWDHQADLVPNTEAARANGLAFFAGKAYEILFAGVALSLMLDARKDRLPENSGA